MSVSNVSCDAGADFSNWLGAENKLCSKLMLEQVVFFLPVCTFLVGVILCWAFYWKLRIQHIDYSNILTLLECVIALFAIPALFLIKSHDPINGTYPHGYVLLAVLSVVSACAGWQLTKRTRN